MSAPPSARRCSFSPQSANANGLLASLTINCTGADAIYYTTDGTLPTTSSISVASGTDLAAAAGGYSEGTVIIAYAVKGGKPGRYSLFAYPLYG